MPDTSPTSVDLDALERHALEAEEVWGPGCVECECGPALLRSVIAELRSTRVELADEIKWRNRILDRSRASIGPDSERIRELEAENAELRVQLSSARTDAASLLRDSSGFLAVLMGHVETLAQRLRDSETKLRAEMSDV